VLEKTHAHITAVLGNEFKSCCINEASEGGLPEFPPAWLVRLTRGKFSRVEKEEGVLRTREYVGRGMDSWSVQTGNSGGQSARGVGGIGRLVASFTREENIEIHKSDLLQLQVHIRL
jgi:hypothetical protein